jgi:DeoR/GlpR family transcriptional regulator of sugar metabolism
MTENAKEKESAAANALKFLPHDFKSVFLDSSSTVLALARRMDLADKTVMTNNLQTALQLSTVKGINLLLPGGAISKTGASLTGGWTTTLLSEFRFDLMLTSCAALNETTAFETSLDQREVKRTVFERSACRILIVDHTKFPKQETYVFEPLSAFDHVVFDSLASDDSVFPSF